MAQIAEARKPQTVIARIPAPLKVKLEREAARSGMTMNLIMRLALEAYLTK